MTQVTVHVNQIDTATSEGIARNHKVFIDRPVGKGGADAGAMGGELLLMALGGCFNSNLLAAIKARDADIQDVKIEIVGTLASAPSRFSAIEMTINATAVDRAQLEKLVTISERACIVANTLRNSADSQGNALALTIKVGA